MQSALQSVKLPQAVKLASWVKTMPLRQIPSCFGPMNGSCQTLNIHGWRQNYTQLSALAIGSLLFLRPEYQSLVWHFLNQWLLPPLAGRFPYSLLWASIRNGFFLFVSRNENMHGILPSAILSRSLLAPPHVRSKAWDGQEAPLWLGLHDSPMGMYVYHRDTTPPHTHIHLGFTNFQLDKVNVGCCLHSFSQYLKFCFAFLLNSYVLF